MSAPQTWVEALNISPESLAEWSAQAPSGKPLLVYCLEQGLIDAQEYLQWASQHFAMPILQANYFQTGFDSSFLETARSDSAWTSWCFPIDAWEGLTYVACVEPPHERSENTCYLLSDPRPMLEVWGVTQTSVISEADMPAGLTSSAKPFILNLDNATIGETQAPVETPAEIEAPPEITRSSKPFDDSAEIDELFTSLRDRYTGSLVMKCTDPSNAQLYKWDSQLSPKDGGKISFNLSDPTFLRIVLKTGHPYHGYVIDSPAHREFFASLGITDLPKCVTAIPVLIEGHLWGVVVAFGTEDKQKMENLEFAQSVTERLIHQVGSGWLKAS